MGYWFGFAAVAGAFGGLIAFGVQSLNFGPPLKTPGAIGGESDWKILFLLEVGSPSSPCQVRSSQTLPISFPL
jgi:hypothetical protein